MGRRTLSGEDGAVEAYLAFLKAGGSGYALDILRAAEVDLTSPEQVQAAFGVLEEMISRVGALFA